MTRWIVLLCGVGFIGCEESRIEPLPDGEMARPPGSIDSSEEAENQFSNGNLASGTVIAPDLPAPPSSYLEVSQVFSGEVRVPGGDFRTLHVRQTSSPDELVSANGNGIFQQRTFNFAPLDFNAADGPVTLRITKAPTQIPEAISDQAANVEIVGASSGPFKVDAHTFEFTIDSPRYVAIKVATSSNLNEHDQHRAVKNMLVIFADPDDADLDEPLASSGEDKVVYGGSTTYDELVNADLIVFRQGFHDIRARGNDYVDASIDPWRHGAVPVTDGTRVWLHPEAVVAGHIVGVDDNGDNYGEWSVADDVEIYGRGLLYMGDFRNDPSSPNTGPYWRPDDPAHTHVSSPAMYEAIGLNGGERTTLRGILIGDIMWHGVVVGWSSVIDRAKIWGWHGNNDNFRPHNGSIVQRSFMRPVDDAFYAFDIDVEDNLLWPSYNGARVRVPGQPLPRWRATEGARLQWWLGLDDGHR